MRLLLVGGPDAHGVALARALQRLGHRVARLRAAGALDGVQADDDRPGQLIDGVPCATLRAAPTAALAAWVRGWRPELVHRWLDADGAFAAAADGLLAGLPGPPGTAALPRVLSVCSAGAVRCTDAPVRLARCDAVVACGAAAWRAVRERPGAASPARCWRIDQGLDLTPLAATRGARAQRPERTAAAPLKVGVVGGAESAALARALGAAGRGLTVVVLPPAALEGAGAAEHVGHCELLCVSSIDPPHAHHASLLAAALGVPQLVQGEPWPRADGEPAVGPDADDDRAPADWVRWLRRWTDDAAWRERLALAVPLPPRIEEEAVLLEQVYREVLGAVRVVR